MSALLEQYRTHPILIFVDAVWVINACMNFAMGQVIGGGGLWGLLIGSVFVCVAALGAYAAAAQATAFGVVRTGLWVLVVGQLCLGQVAGWQSLGLTLDRGATQLKDKATTRDTRETSLKSKRTELEKIGIVRPVAAVEADMTLECEKKSRVYRDGVGPKCTGFRTELATAKRARDLEKEIEGLTGKLAAGPAVSAANAGTAVPEALASWVATAAVGKPVVVSSEDILFGLQVFLVALLEFVATLGRWLFGGDVRQPPASSSRRAPGGGGSAMGAGGTPSPRPPTPSDPVLFDPRMLPPAWQARMPQIAPANDGGGSMPAHGGGAVNVINVGPGQAGPQRLLPPRVAARRGH